MKELAVERVNFQRFKVAHHFYVNFEFSDSK